MKLRLPFVQPFFIFLRKNPLRIFARKFVSPMNDTREPSDLDRHVVEMLTLATEYFRFLENLEKVEKADFLIFIKKLSALLYAKGLLFPETSVPDESGNERFVTEEEWENIFNSVRAKLGNEDEFFYLESPDIAEEISKGSLAEMMADVYQDLKDFAMLLTKPTQLAHDNAIYEIRQLFGSHWGIRLLRIQQVLISRSVSASDEVETIDW